VFESARGAHEVAQYSYHELDDITMMLRVRHAHPHGHAVVAQSPISLRMIAGISRAAPASDACDCGSR